MPSYADEMSAALSAVTAYLPAAYLPAGAPGTPPNRHSLAHVAAALGEDGLDMYEQPPDDHRAVASLAPAVRAARPVKTVDLLGRVRCSHPRTPPWWRMV